MLYGDEIASSVKRNQVYQATHNGEGQSLPYMNRSFISFTYGGKKIEDFDLLATINGERLNRAGYASFEDTITTYDNLDGQRYWATHYKTNQIDFTLSTDGIEQRVLDDFLSWFRAGTSRELILAEHPNRAIMARVAQPPQLNLLPFESNVTFKISSVTRQTKTTLYKGDITLSLIMDEPHWYSIMNVLGKKSDVGGHQRYEDVWTDVTTGNEISIFASQDALKILYEDGIPLGSMIERNMLLGNGAYANVENQVISLVWNKNEEDEDFEEGKGAKIDSGDGTVGIIAGAIVDASDNGITTLPPYTDAYFFYAGNAPSPTIISFDIQPSFDSQGYFTALKSVLVNPSMPYNIFVIESVEAQQLKFTTPNLFTSYNKLVKIIQEGFYPGVMLSSLREKVLSEVKHPIARAWGMSLLTDEAQASDDPLSIETIAEHLTALFKNDDKTYDPIHFSFNSKTGEAIANIHYRQASEQMGLQTFVYEDNAINKLNTIQAYDETLTDKERYENLETWGWAQYCLGTTNTLVTPDPEDLQSYTLALQAFFAYFEQCYTNGVSIPTIFTVLESPVVLSSYHETTEDVGDMLYSNYIIIREKNYPTSYGKITSWGPGTEESRRYSHRIYHDVSGGLSNLQILYKNMYF